MSKPKKGNGGRKVSGEKRRKQSWMWIEQVYYKLDEYERRIKIIEDKVAAIELLLSLDNMTEHMKIHLAALSKLAGKK